MSIPEADICKSSTCCENEKKMPSFVQNAKFADNKDNLQIVPIKCHNDYVAIIRRKVESSLVYAEDSAMYQNEGVVIGVGPGLSDNSGSRLKPTVNIGDYV